MRSIAIRCWPFAAPSITAPSIRCLRGTNGVSGKRKNDRMLPLLSLFSHSSKKGATVRLLHPPGYATSRPDSWPARYAGWG